MTLCVVTSGAPGRTTVRCHAEIIYQTLIELFTFAGECRLHTNRHRAHEGSIDIMILWRIDWGLLSFAADSASACCSASRSFIAIIHF